jgi:hypothetical protein
MNLKMESVEHYYNSRIRLFLSCALLLTWEFFGKQTKSDIDFEYLNISIATEAIPFLLSMLILFNTYSFSLHFKIIDNTKKIKLSVFDYYLTLIVSLFSLIINYFYQVKHSKSEAFIWITLEPLIYVFLILNDLKLIYTLKRKNLSYKPSFLLILISWIGLVGLSIILIYTILTLRKQNHLNIFENIYFFSFNIIVLIFFEWAFIPKK